MPEHGGQRGGCVAGMHGRMAPGRGGQPPAPGPACAAPLGSKSEPPLPPPMGSVVRLFLKIWGGERAGGAVVRGG